jgi:hypothetical protein
MAASPPNDYERSDVDPRLIASIALGLAVFLGLTPVLLRVSYPLATQHAEAEGYLPPPPRLETHPRVTLAQLRAREHAALTRYRWIDRDRGIAQIPIDHAITILSEKGLPGWPASQAKAAQ